MQESATSLEAELEEIFLDGLVAEAGIVPAGGTRLCMIVALLECV